MHFKYLGKVIHNGMVLFVSLVIAVITSLQVCARDAYFNIPITSLKLTEGSLPEENSLDGQRFWFNRGAFEPYAILDGPGEAYLTGPDRPFPGAMPLGIAGQMLCISVPAGDDISGRLFLPKHDFSGMVQVRFMVPATVATDGGRTNFLAAKQRFYQDQLNRNIPGAAWFRHQVAVTAALRGEKVTPGRNVAFGRPFNSSPDFQIEQTFELFSGARAMGENLQLDRSIPPFDDHAAGNVALTNLTGITASKIDWKPLLAPVPPAFDPLAAYIPADQHAIFFPSFNSMVLTMDEAELDGTPLLQAFEERSEDATTRTRYQEQLCLGLNDLSRLFGPNLVARVAFTGSDPYLRAGSDLAVLFQTTDPQVLEASIMAHYAAARVPARKGSFPVMPSNGNIIGIPFTGVVSRDRSVSSYMACVSNVVIVANSPKQLERLVYTALGRIPALNTQDEYRYFRQKYPLGSDGETAFIVLSDAAIRRWCGPQWRIGDSRRTRAVAVLAELQAAHLDDLVHHRVTPTALASEYSMPQLGDLNLTDSGVMSSTYGTLDFLTPVSELAFDTVSQDEAKAYEHWRDNYQTRWRYFDPIAIRLSLTHGVLSAAFTVTPLIGGSDYNSLVDFTTGSQILPGSGDPHTNALARLAVAVNTQSRAVQEAGDFVGSTIPGVRANFLSWLGKSMTVYADDDPFWAELSAATNVDAFLEHAYSRLPIAFYFEVKNPLGVAAFLTSLHAYVDQSAPQMTVWETHDYHGRPYVKILPNRVAAQDDPEDNWAVYYAVAPDSLTVSLSEDLLKRALDRQTARTNGSVMANAANLHPWLGTNVCLQVDKKFIAALIKAADADYQTRQQNLAWSNIPILNEWKRLYPDQDPVKLHEAWWGVKLISPGGGDYVWNEQWHTMESTVYGHPGQPKMGTLASPLESLLDANLGVTFENNGLSARAILHH